MLTKQRGGLQGRPEVHPKHQAEHTQRGLARHIRREEQELRGLQQGDGLEHEGRKRGEATQETGQDQHPDTRGRTDVLLEYGPGQPEEETAQQVHHEGAKGESRNRQGLHQAAEPVAHQRTGGSAGQDQQGFIHILLLRQARSCLERALFSRHLLICVVCSPPVYLSLARFVR
ncbi:hypothetical protein NKDENANG_01018 [Candidatus Entotheonellaceae bacterium PAL068K]